MEKKDLYTLTVFSENNSGSTEYDCLYLTRRQMNIETLSVSPSAIQGIHNLPLPPCRCREYGTKVSGHDR